MQAVFERASALLFFPKTSPCAAGACEESLLALLMVVGSSGCAEAGAAARSQGLASVAVGTIVGHTCTLLTAS